MGHYLRMKYQVYCQRTGFAAEWAWNYARIKDARSYAKELVGRGYDLAWVLRDDALVYKVGQS